MRKKHKKLIVCTVVAMLGLSYISYPIHAQETQATEQTGTDELLEHDETAVPVEDSTETETTPETDEADKEEFTSEPVKTEQETQSEAEKFTDEEVEQQEQTEQQENAVLLADNTGDFTVTGDGTYGTDYTYENSTLTFLNSGTYTVTGNTTTDKIKVNGSLTVKITLDNLNIDVSGTGNACAFEIDGTSTATITLEGVNTLKSGYFCAGLQYNNAIEDKSLTIEGTGSLTATGGESGAGIGGGYDTSGNNIKINGGTVTATGGDVYGAYGTVVRAGAGIGGGANGSGNNITITGGTITATSGYVHYAFGTDVQDGAGIGGGANGSGNNITITGGTVTASSEYEGAGIGGGYGGSAEYITITGGSVTATGGRDGAGIGGGSGSGENITIKNAEVISKGYTGIGGGSSGSGKYIIIENAKVTATGSREAGIGGGIYASGENITIKNSEVTATGSDGAGIGGGRNGSGNNITIIGGTVTATSGGYGAGIGGGYNGSGEDITIKNSIVTATGGDDGAGIGGGIYGSGENITITGGTVTATGGGYGAGIGGGGSYSSTESSGSAKNITINGGTVTATGGAVDIGGKGSTENFIITGGSVKAETIGATPTDGTNDVYLARLENQDGIDQVTVDNGTEEKTFTRQGNHPNNDSTFYLYLTGQDHTIKTGDKTYTAKWQSDSNSFKWKVSAPDVTIESTTASSITVSPLANQDTYGEAQYSINGTDWQDSNVFTNLSAGKSYSVSAKYIGNDSYLQSDAGTAENVSTNMASYTVTIPAVTLEAGKDDSTSTISVNQDQSFDLGYNGQVDVKIQNNVKVTDKAELMLTRQNDTEINFITSALLVNNTALGDINKSVAAFKTKNDSPVTISFAKPTETNILAGTYTGTITFVVSYSEQ